MKKHGYENWTSVDFVKDPRFLHWRLFLDEESTLFWNTFLAEHPEKKEEIAFAIKIFDSIRFNHYELSEEEIIAQKNGIDERIRQFKNEDKKRVARLRKVASVFLRIAAIIALPVCLYFLLDSPQKETEENRSAQNERRIIIEKNDTAAKDIRIVLSDNRSITLDHDADIVYDNKGNIVVNGEQKAETGHLRTAFEETAFNKLIVPWGKRSSLVLPDGSKIWVNSGSTLEFPAAFDKRKREVRLNGEIYIEVARDDAKPFIVRAPKFSVNVLGTKFDISAYAEDEIHSVVLVKGSVEVIAPSAAPQKMQPTDMLTLHEGNFRKEQVDVYSYISWKDNLICLYNEPVKNLLTRLSRYYDIPIEIIGDVADVNINMTGKLLLLDDFNAILENISVISPIRYEWQGNKVIIRGK